MNWSCWLCPQNPLCSYIAVATDSAFDMACKRACKQEHKTRMIWMTDSVHTGDTPSRRSRRNRPAKFVSVTNKREWFILRVNACDTDHPITQTTRSRFPHNAQWHKLSPFESGEKRSENQFVHRWAGSRVRSFCSRVALASIHPFISPSRFNRHHSTG